MAQSAAAGGLVEPEAVGQCAGGGEQAELVVVRCVTHAPMMNEGCHGWVRQDRAATTDTAMAIRPTAIGAT